MQTCGCNTRWTPWAAPRAAFFVLIFLLGQAHAVGEKGEGRFTGPFKIGYLEAGSFWTFSGTMEATTKALEQMGWKDRFQFPEDARFSPGWEKEGELQARAVQLMNRQDLSLIIAGGTAAAKALLKVNNGRTPILAIAVSDPVRAGLVASEKDSGTDNFTVRIVPDQYPRMFRIFHDVVGFKKLGLMYSDTEDGRQYANVEDARLVARERGFEVIEYSRLSRSESTEECVQGIRTLIGQGIDAFFIPALICFDWKAGDVKKLLDLLMEEKIPTFSREGALHVKAGALMGFSTLDFTSRGIFTADKIIRILEGVKPRDLPMLDEATPRISLNLAVSSKIGFDLPFDLLAASDEIFQGIVLPEDRLVK